MRMFLPTVFLLSILSVSVSAQVLQGGAEVLYAEGNGFVLVSDGERRTYSITSDDVPGLSLKEGDTLMTDEGSFLGLGLPDGSGAVIKVAENTTITLEELSPEGGGVLQMTYGRIRIRVGALPGGSILWVSGPDMIAGVRGTDFGYDVSYNELSPGNATDTAVYCFEGSVNVFRTNQTQTSKLDLLDRKPHVVAADTMVRATSASPEEKLLNIPIETEIRDYWDMSPFYTAEDETPAPSIPILEPQKVEVTEELVLEENPRKAEIALGGRIFFASGIGMATLGGILRTVQPQNQTFLDASLGLLTVGAAATVIGGGFLIYSISLP